MKPRTFKANFDFEFGIFGNIVVPIAFTKVGWNTTNTSRSNTHLAFVTFITVSIQVRHVDPYNTRKTQAFLTQLKCAYIGMRLHGTHPCVTECALRHYIGLKRVRYDRKQFTRRLLRSFCLVTCGQSDTGNDFYPYLREIRSDQLIS